MRACLWIAGFITFALAARADGPTRLSCAELYQQMKSDYEASPDAAALSAWEARVKSNLPAFDDIARTLSENYLKTVTDYDRRLLQSFLDGDYSDFNALLKRFFEPPRTDGIQRFSDPECQPGDRRQEILSSKLTGRAAGLTVEQTRNGETYLLFCQRLKSGQDPKNDDSWVGAEPLRYSSFQVKTEDVLAARQELYKRIQGRLSLIPSGEREHELRGASLFFVENLNARRSGGDDGSSSQRRLSAARVPFSLFDILRFKTSAVTGRQLAEAVDPRPVVSTFEEKWVAQRPRRCPSEMPAGGGTEKSAAAAPKPL